MSFPVAITGAGVITAAGRGLDAAWEALCRGETFLSPDSDPDLDEDLEPFAHLTVKAMGAGRDPILFPVTCRIDTPVEVDYYRNGGILHTVLRKLAGIC